MLKVASPPEFKKVMLAYSFLCIVSVVFSAERQTLWTGGEDGYSGYRIPAIVRTPDDTLLAFCEARKNSLADQGDIDLVIRRSHDNGQTWSPSAVIFDGDGDAEITIGNPCPVVDPGRDCTHLIFCRDNHEIFYTSSTDAGQAWKAPIDISAVLKDFDYNVVRVGAGPGHGLLTREGHIIVPVWVCDREVKDVNKSVALDRYRAGVIRSTDGGQSWSAGGLVPANLNRLNESMVVELPDGRLLLNSRTYEVGYRTQSISADGGLTWSDPDLVTALPDATVQGSLLKHSSGQLLFSNIPTPVSAGNNTARRRGLTLKTSFDDGRTWSGPVVIEAGPSAYSDLVELPDGDVLCLFECGEQRYNERIDIIRIKKPGQP